MNWFLKSKSKTIMATAKREVTFYRRENLMLPKPKKQYNLPRYGPETQENAGIDK